ncbi:MAG: hypothetical protein WD398_15685 [Cyclobacteriaceae bacterium]
MNINPSKTIRNLTLFCIIALSIGWLGVWIDEKLPHQEGDETLGMAIWLVTPLVLVVLLRTFFGDGWKDAGLKPNFKDKKKWYFVSFLIFPLVTLIILTIGKITGWIAFSNFDLQGYGNVFMGIAILNMLVWTVMFTEIFRLTRSIWPVILLHTMEDALINHLVIDGYIQIAPHKAIWISPICGIIPSFLYFLIGIWLRKERLNKRSSSSKMEINYSLNL